MAAAEPVAPRRLAGLPPAGVPRRLPLHPGWFLQRHYLTPLGITQTEAARHLGISRQRLNELIQGHRAMTPDTALRCTLAFGLPVTHWLALQGEWDAYQAWRLLRRQGGPGIAPWPAPGAAAAPAATVPRPRLASADADTCVSA